MLPFLPIRNQCAACARTFSTSTRLSWKANKNALTQEHAGLPSYPYGPAQWYKQSNKGLYGGQRVQVGNNISERTETKSRRTWHPNINRKKLFSQALNRNVRVRVSTRVLRTIDKVGGLDNYLLGEKTGRIKELGMGGWKLRCEVMATAKVQKRFNEQRRALGLPEVDYDTLIREQSLEMLGTLLGYAETYGTKETAELENAKKMQAVLMQVYGESAEFAVEDEQEEVLDGNEDFAAADFEALPAGQTNGEAMFTDREGDTRRTGL